MATQAHTPGKYTHPFHGDSAPYWFGDRPAPAIRKVTVDQSARWLARGWSDLWSCPRVSLTYGALFAVAAWLIFYGLARAEMSSLILPLTAGFMLVGPIAAVGLYEVSRRHAARDSVTLRDAFRAFARSAQPLMVIGLTLMLTLLTWFMVAMWIFAAFYESAPPTLSVFLTAMLTADQAPLFLLVGTAAGAILASGVFALSALSLPMVIDRDIGPVHAMAISVRAVALNWRMMIGWAAMIVLITGFGLATFYVGLAITLPLIGHATWHAYKAIIGEDRDSVS